MNTKILTMLLVPLLVLTAAAYAQDNSDRIQELQEQFKQRDPQIQQAKRAGIIGETSEGFVDFVEQSDEKYADVVEEENSDRRELYGLIAEQEKTTPEKVARRNAKRNFERARSGDYLKEDGTWRRKE